MFTSHKVSDSLYLVRGVLTNKAPAKPVEVPVNHVVVIDCSGSMAYDLPKIREQLKRKLPKLLQEKDTISIVWFSGRGQFGALLEAEPVATLADLKDVNAAIDRWLKPVGLTGFKEPLEEASKLVGRVAKKLPGSTFSLFFMSDGCDNQWGRAEILKACEGTAGGVSAATFVEYGYYADRPLLTAMAEKAGGTLIFSEDFDRFSPLFDSAMQRKLSGAPRVEVKIKGDTIGGFVFAMVDGDLITFEASSGSIAVPADLAEVYYLSPSVIGNQADSIAPLADHYANCGETNLDRIAPISAAYAAVSLFAIRMKSDVVFPLLKSLGDVKLISQFSTCFGKQKYSDFMDVSKKAAFGEGRFEAGWDPKKVPKDDAFTLLELLNLLSDDESNRVLLDRPEFKYSKIGRGRVDSNEVLTAEELEEIRLLTVQIASEKNPIKIKEHNARIAAITDSKGPGLKFEADPAPDGYPINSLTFNEERPNVSFLIKRTGTVDLSTKLPADLKGKISEKFQTFVFRNYTAIKDGLVNIENLPVRVTESVWKKLCVEGLASGAYTNGEVVLNLRSLPVINRKMVKAVSAQTFFEAKYALTKSQAAQKVYNAYVKELLPAKKSEGWAVQYGDAAATWLKEAGFTEWSGFGPKTVQAEATDFYMGKELHTLLKGLSSLPSLKEAKEKISKGKPNAGTLLMKETIEEVEEFLNSKAYKNAATKESMLENWLNGQAKASKSTARKLIFDIAQTTFCLVVGQVWFSEFKSLDENTLTIKVDGQEIEGKVEMKEIQIKI